jgi:uncharacterized membrane protein
MAGNLKQISLYAQAIFYFSAGINHFINPHFYTGLIPDYLPWHELINTTSGLFEIALGALLIPTKTRKYAAWGIVMMLIAFIPSHWYFIQIGSCIDDGLCVAPWLAWLRLLAIHPLLILWAYSHRK